MDWETSIDQRLERIETSSIEMHGEMHARLMALELSNSRIVDLFEKLWDGFSQFKDSPVLRMFASGVAKKKEIVKHDATG